MCVGMLVLFYLGQYTASPVPLIMLNSTPYCDSLVRVNDSLHKDLKYKNSRIMELLTINAFLVDSINNQRKD